MAEFQKVWDLNRVSARDFAEAMVSPSAQVSVLIMNLSVCANLFGWMSSYQLRLVVGLEVKYPMSFLCDFGFDFDGIHLYPQLSETRNTISIDDFSIPTYFTFLACIYLVLNLLPLLRDLKCVSRRRRPSYKRPRSGRLS